MKKNVLIIQLVAAFLLTACSDIVEPTKDPEVNGASLISAISTPFTIEEDAENHTRSTLTWGSQVIFGWEENDRILVFPKTPDPNSRSVNIYTLVGDPVENKASFKGEGFSLSVGKSYYGVSPYIETYDNSGQVISTNITTESLYDVRFSYEGQRQTENFSTAHLGDFDYQAAYATVEREGDASFHFRHLGSPMRIRSAVSPGEYTKLEIIAIDAENHSYNINPVRSIDLSLGGEPGDAYAPHLTPRSDNHSETFTLLLGEDEDHGIQITTGGTGELLTMFMMFPVTSELKNLSLCGRLTKKNPDSSTEYLYIPLKSREFVANKAVNDGGDAKPATKLSFSIRINKEWDYGNTQNVDITDTRAAGDPGYNTTLDLPTHLYAYTCIDGILKDVQSFTDINNEKWTEKDHYWEYKDKIEVDFSALNKTSDNIHTYIIASNGALPTHTSLAVDGNESAVVAATMDLSALGEDSRQDLLKNTYSYDLKTTYENPNLTITLHHLGAKLDVQWNNTTAAQLAGNLTINNLPTTIFMFKPTENSGGSWAPSFVHTSGTCWNGRTVFYVPQLAVSSPQKVTYNVTLGTGVTQNVVFDVPAAGTVTPFTSWFKANVVLK